MTFSFPLSVFSFLPSLHFHFTLAFPGTAVCCLSSSFIGHFAMQLYLGLQGGLSSSSSSSKTCACFVSPLDEGLISAAPLPPPYHHYTLQALLFFTSPLPTHSFTQTPPHAFTIRRYTNNTLDQPHNLHVSR